MNTHVFKRQGAELEQAGTGGVQTECREKFFYQENSKAVEQVAQRGCDVTLEI